MFVYCLDILGMYTMYLCYISILCVYIICKPDILYISFYPSVHLSICTLYVSFIYTVWTLRIYAMCYNMYIICVWYERILCIYTTYVYYVCILCIFTMLVYYVWLICLHTVILCMYAMYEHAVCIFRIYIACIYIACICILYVSVLCICRYVLCMYILRMVCLFCVCFWCMYNVYLFFLCIKYTFIIYLHNIHA